MPPARIHIEELLKWQTRLPTPTFWNAKGGEGFPGGRPGAYLVAKPVKLNRALQLMRLLA